MKLQIPVGKWLHGRRDRDKKFDDSADTPGSMLHRPNDDKMCCIGHYLLSCGVPLEKLTDQTSPDDVARFIPEEAQWLLKGKYECSADACELMTANDNSPVRRKIKSIFAKHDVQVEFVK